MTAPRRPVRLTLGLMLLAPIVGEYLLGNTPISQIGALLLYLPLYGAGAVVVRECGRRLGGWPTIALFAAAYALIEEGPVDQMVFNPGYLGLGSFDGYGEVPGLGISGTLVLYSLALHTVWSICVPIAIVESFDPTPGEPWLGCRGLAASWRSSSGGVCRSPSCRRPTRTSWGHRCSSSSPRSSSRELVLAGVLVGRRPARSRVPGDPPRPLLVGLAAFVLTSAYWFGSGVPGLLLQTAWLALAVVVGVVALRRWSRRAGWGGRHALAAAAGATATYALWFGPAQAVEAGTGADEIAIGAVVFGVLLLVILYAGAQSLRARLRSGP